MILKKRSDQQGFTIVELMIAAAVLSTILVIISATMIGIGILFSKGINQSHVQDNVRSISDELAQHLELSNQFKGPTSRVVGGATIQAYCMDATRYSFVIGQQLGSPIAHVLWRDTDLVGDCQPPDLTQVTPSPGGTELITPHSRLTNFDIAHTSPSDPYVLTVGVAFGDNDLLCSASVAGSCNNPGTTLTAAQFQNGDLQCKGLSGQQFCGVSKLTTTVVQRISGS